MKASDLFVKALENEGVEYIFGIPGEENLDFLESLRVSKIKFILTRHEQSAGFMAATYGRLTGKVGVCLSTLGPGAANLVTAAAYAPRGGMPMLMITGQKPIKVSKQGKFQIINVVEMMRPLTKFTKQIVNGNNIPSLVREAVRLAEEERPGAVHLELPEDVAREDTRNKPFNIMKIRRPTANERSIDLAVQMIRDAKRPLLLIGAAANRKHTSRTLRELVDATGIHFFNTQMGKGVIDERHPAFLGTAAISSQDYIHCAIERADLIINVGHDVIEKPPFIMEPGGLQVIHVNFSSAQVDDVYFPQHELVGDITDTVRKIKDKMVKSPNWDFDYYHRVKQDVEIHLHDRNSDSRFPIIPQRLVADVRAAMPPDGIIALDNGLYKIWFARNYKAYEPNTVLLDNALATMGAGLPSAIGARLVNKDKKILAICGDGGFMMNSHELETAVRLKIDLCILVLRDDALGMIKWKQEGMGFENFGLDYGNPDFVKFAGCFGAHGHRVTGAERLRHTIKDCLNSPGVHLIEVPIDYSESYAVFYEELKSRLCVL